MPVVDLDALAHEALLHDFQNQVHVIRQMRPRLSELAEQYEQRRSRIERLVAWYSSKSWWEKFGLGGSVALTSFAVGSLFGLACLSMLLVMTLYIFAVSIIDEHAELMRQRGVAFDDIPRMEALLSSSIESFRELEGKLTTVLQSLDSLSVQRAEGVSDFKENVNAMGGHNQHYTSFLDALNEVTEKLAAHQHGVALDEAELHGLYTELCDRLKEAETLTSTLSGLVSTALQELKENASSNTLGSQDEVEMPSMSPQVVHRLGEIDRKIALHQNIHPLNEGQQASQDPVDERIEGFDRAIQELLQADDASKVRHQERSNESPGGVVFRLPLLL